MRWVHDCAVCYDAMEQATQDFDLSVRVADEEMLDLSPRWAAD